MSGIGKSRFLQLVADAAIVAVSWFLAFELRFDHGLPVYYDTLLRRTILLVVVIKLAVFLLFGFHRRWWRYVSVRDMWSAARGVVVASLVADVTVYFASPVHNVRLPRSIAAMDLLITLALVAGARLLTRTLMERPRFGVVARGKEVIVVGAGDAGRLIVQEMQRSRMLAYTPIAFIDDDERKRNTRILGVRVVGTMAELPRIVREYKPDEVLIAIPSASGEMRRRVVEAAQGSNVPVKTLPGLYELITGDVNLAGQIRPVQVEDVLGREQVEVDFESVASYLKGQTVLVTGAGGSIGSELCRQIARVGPTRLILVDNGETALFDIERELVDERDFTAAVPKLVDVRNRAAFRREVFEKYKPTVVFHAAAYKHVPLMETHPLESVRNNVVGTRITAELSAEFGVERFVLISTDKAVNPKTVMGQSKALCEWVIESLGHRRDVHDALRRRPLRQRAQLVRLGDPDVPAADRARRPGDGDASRDDALLHDHPGGGVARRAGGRDRRPRTDLRPRHGRAREDRRSRDEHGAALRARAAPAGRSGDRPARRAHRVRRLAAGREDPRGALERRRGRRRDRASQDQAAVPSADRRRVARGAARRARRARRRGRHAGGGGEARRDRARARPRDYGVAGGPPTHRSVTANGRRTVCVRVNSDR